MGEISHFLIETAKPTWERQRKIPGYEVAAKHAWIVLRDSAIEGTSHETWNGYCKQFLRLFLRINEASFIISCFNFNF